MNTCETCIWWGNVRNHIFRGKKKRCSHIVEGEGSVGTAGVSPIHDNDFLSDLFTSPDFGCLHHRPK